LKPRPRKPGLELSLWDQQSLWREPWWNADGRARLARRALHRQVQPLPRLSAFRLPFLLSFLSVLKAQIVTAPATTASVI
jgi:hypothetical protein